ncbi:hypothetical protein ACTXT7_010021 [Hymenolepis weldensis]
MKAYHPDLPREERDNDKKSLSPVVLVSLKVLPAKTLIQAATDNMIVTHESSTIIKSSKCLRHSNHIRAKPKDDKCKEPEEIVFAKLLHHTKGTVSKSYISLSGPLRDISFLIRYQTTPNVAAPDASEDRENDSKWIQRSKFPEAGRI